MKVDLTSLEYKFGDTLTAQIEGVADWAAVLLKNPRYVGHELRGSPVLLVQSGLPNNTPTQLQIKLKWGGWMSGVVAPGTYLLKVFGHDSSFVGYEVDNFIKIT